MSTEVEFAQALVPAIRALNGQSRFELMVGSGLLVSVFADADFSETDLEPRALVLTQMACAQMKRRRDAETCDHDWWEFQAHYLDGELDAVCKNCGWRRSEPQPETAA